MSTLQILYIMLAFVGAVMLIISIFGGDTDGIDLDVDGDFDISDAESGVDSPGIFSIKSFSTFALAFGLAGMVVIHMGGGILLQLIWGAVAGLIVSTLYLLVMKLMYSQQGSSLKDAKSFIGKNATVSIPTTDSGKGQIKIGMTEYSCIEKNNKKLVQNQIVKVVNIVDPGTLLVESK